MSRRIRKKRHKLKPAHAYRYWLLRLKLWTPSLVRALVVPTLVLCAYLVLRFLGVFSVYYPELHWVAWFVFIIWYVQAIRGAVGYWAHRAHLRFFVPVLFLVALGSSWPCFSKAPIKVWVTPPLYAQLPSEALQDGVWKEQPAVLEGSQIHVSWEDENDPVELSFNGERTKLDYYGIHEPVATFNVPVGDRSQSYELVAQEGWQRLGSWRFKTVIDEEPSVSLIGAPEVTIRKTIRFAYKAVDDFGVKSIVARVTPTASSMQEVSRSIDIPLRTPHKQSIDTVSYVDLTFLPWSGIPVTVQLMVEDGAGQKGWSVPKILTLPSRSFHNPFARALIEEREKLLRQPDAAMRDEAANVMAGIARQQSLFSGDPAVMMSLRAGAVRLVVNHDPETINAVGAVLWQSALQLEEGSIGSARKALAQATQELSLALLHKTSEQALPSYVAHIAKAMAGYFDSIDKERAKQPPSLQEVDWPLAQLQEIRAPEDLTAQLDDINALLKEGQIKDAQDKLVQLNDVIENLRTTAPELTPTQALIARQVTILRALVRGQTELVSSLEPLAKINRKTRKGRKSFKNGLAHQVGQQKLLLSALHDVITQSGLKSMEAKAGELAMKRVIKALTKKEMEIASQKQAEALALLQNSLLSLTEQMRRSLAAKVD